MFFLLNICCCSSDIKSHIPVKNLESKLSVLIFKSHPHMNRDFTIKLLRKSKGIHSLTYSSFRQRLYDSIIFHPIFNHTLLRLTALDSLVTIKSVQASSFVNLRCTQELLVVWHSKIHAIALQLLPQVKDQLLPPNLNSESQPFHYLRN